MDMRDLHELRILERAEQIWHGFGQPDGGVDIYRDVASHLVAIEESFETALRPFEHLLMAGGRDDEGTTTSGPAEETSTGEQPMPARRRRGAVD